MERNREAVRAAFPWSDDSVRYLDRIVTKMMIQLIDNVKKITGRDKKALQYL